MKKKLTVTLLICMTIVMCISVSATSYYEYDNKMSDIGMELTSALYLTYSSDYEYVNVNGITRVDTGSSPAYESFTMYSQVSYSYFISSTETNRIYEEPIFQDVIDASPNSGYYISKHGFDNAASNALFGWGFHEGWATDEKGNTILSAPETRGSGVSQYSLNEVAEINEMMS